MYRPRIKPLRSSLDAPLLPVKGRRPISHGHSPVGDERALAALLSRAESDPAFYAELPRLARIRRGLMRPEREASRLRQAVAEFECAAGQAATPEMGG
jgi:hypothetical protein